MMKNSLMICLVLFIGTMSFAQKPPKTQSIVIQTSAECNDCKERLESNLNYTKGVVFAELDLDSKKLTVKYKTAKLNADKIREQVSKLGYQADNIAADPVAYDKLPSCCKVGGGESHGEH